jgi:hypothetical protein
VPESPGAPTDGGCGWVVGGGSVVVVVVGAAVVVGAIVVVGGLVVVVTGFVVVAVLAVVDNVDEDEVEPLSVPTKSDVRCVAAVVDIESDDPSGEKLSGMYPSSERSCCNLSSDAGAILNLAMRDLSRAPPPVLVTP